MRITLEQQLPVGPEAAWPFVTVPELMNRWSQASVHPLAAGDGGDPSGVGATRSIALRALGRTIEFEEVIERCEPPRVLVYRVVSGLPVRSHRGEITLVTSGAGTRLRWQVDFDFLVPGFGLAARALLEAQLGSSLERLALAVHGASPCTPARSVSIDGEVELPDLVGRAEAIRDQQRALADRLEAAGDPKHWFTRVYEYVTESQLELCRRRGVSHPAWVLRIVPRFHDYYVTSLTRWLREAPGSPEYHWRSAFRAMDLAPRWFPRPLEAITYGLAKGVQAHIEEDLPRALADVYVDSYAGVCGYARFRADYLAMGDVFRVASKRLLARIPAASLPLFARVLGPFVPDEGQAALIHRRFYDVPRQRRRAFERGERLAHWVLAKRV